MGLFDFFKKPQWKHSNSKIRLAAVDEMNVDDLETLIEIIRHDSDQQVRLAALAKVDDQQSLEMLQDKELPEKITGPLRERLEKIYADLIISGSDECNPDELLVRITEPDLLARIAVEAEAVDLRCRAVAAIDEPMVLCDILARHCGKKPALVAVKKINDPGILADIVAKAVNKSARAMAAKKLAATEGEGDEIQEVDPVPEPAAEEKTTPEQEENREEKARRTAEQIRKKQQLCDQVELLTREIDEESENRFAEIARNWSNAGPAQDDEQLSDLQKRYESASSTFHTNLNEFKKEKQKKEELAAACGKIENFLRKNNLEKAEELLNAHIKALEGMPRHTLDSSALTARFTACREKLVQSKEEQAERTRLEQEKLQKITDLCAEMEQLITASDRYQAEKQAKTLSRSWGQLYKKTEKQYDALADRFQSASDEFWKKQKQFYKEQEWQRWNNKTRKEELCALAEALNNENDMHQVSAHLKEYQAAWKETGPVSKKDSDALWQRFKSACDENYARCRVFYAELDQKRRESIAVKEKLCEQAEEHVASTQWKETTDILKGLQKEWKEAGPGIRRKDEALYKRFRKACDQFFEQRSIAYAELDAERQENLLAKEKLCQQVEELILEPQLEHDKLIRELQKTWKTIGPVPRKNDQEIWLRFRGACDSYYAWLDEQRQENLQQKIALCEQVEAMLPGNESSLSPEEAIEKIVVLQKEWKTIGPVPWKESDAVWKRFRSQCDSFFAARKTHQEEERIQKIKNQEQKENLLQRAGEIIQQQDEQKISTGLQALQKEWEQTGPAPEEQEQLLQDEFQAMCNAFFHDKEQGDAADSAILDENLKKKEELCFQLERLAGNEHVYGNEDKQAALDLVEQFKIAREANFMLSGKTKDLQKKKEEVRRIQQEWKGMGPTWQEHEQRLWKRYRKAIDLFFAQSAEN
jgi:hypothetical protein